MDVKDFGDVQLGEFVNAFEASNDFNLPNRETHLLKKCDVPILNVEAVSAASKKIAKSTSDILDEGRFVLTLGGDHSIAIGTLSKLSSHFPNLGVIWVDAHSDINTNLTTSTGNMHGMVLSLLLKEMKPYVNIPQFSWLQPCLSAKNFVYIGLRDVEPFEKSFIQKLGIKSYSMADVDKMGVNDVIDEAISYLSSGDKRRPLHMSFDVDALDDLEIMSTGTPVPGGLSLREGLHIVEEVYEKTNFVSMDIVEFNPYLGSELEVIRSSKAIKELIFSCFGYDRGGLVALDDNSVLVDLPIAKS